MAPQVIELVVVPQVIESVVVPQVMELVVMPQVIESEGLGKYVDADYLKDQLREATGLTSEEMDTAAHQLLTVANQHAAPSHVTDDSVDRYRPSPVNGRQRNVAAAPDSYYDG